MDIGAPTGSHHFRTYAVPKDETYNCKIWEAARATSAAPTYFPRIEIGPLNRKQAFIDAGVGCNNPTNEVIQECELIYGSDAKVACIVSIGTGRPEVIRWEEPRLFQKAFPIELCNALAKACYRHRSHGRTAPAKIFEQFNDCLLATECVSRTSNYFSRRMGETRRS